MAVEGLEGGLGREVFPFFPTHRVPENVPPLVPEGMCCQLSPEDNHSGYDTERLGLSVTLVIMGYSPGGAFVALLLIHTLL